MKLALHWETCVRSRSRAAGCQRCVEACPVEAVSIAGPRGSVTISREVCTGCGACVGSCPTEAITGTPAPSLGAHLRCEPDACLAALSTEAFLTLALKHRALKIDGAGCSSCEATRDDWLARVERAIDFLAAAGLEASIVVSVQPGKPAVTAPAPSAPPAPSRRALLGRLVPRLSEPAPPPLVLDRPLDPSALKTRSLPATRVALLEALPTSLAKPTSWLASDEVDFTSDKVIDARTCTGCQQCVSVCPTAALTASLDHDAIAFDASRCVKCRACHDVCEPGAITLAPRLELKRFLERRPRELVRYPVKLCGECGARFKYDGGDVRCARCQGMDDEARELHGLPSEQRGGQA